jgi:hypothetical protein
VEADEEQTPLVDFDAAEYLRYREELRADVGATRARYGGSDRYAEIEYSQLLDQAFVGDWLERLFGERVAVEATLRRQRDRPKIEYLRDPSRALAFTADSLSRGFAAP